MDGPLSPIENIGVQHSEKTCSDSGRPVNLRPVKRVHDDECDATDQEQKRTQKCAEFDEHLQNWNKEVTGMRAVYGVLHPMCRGLHRIELNSADFHFGRFPKNLPCYAFQELTDNALRNSISGIHCYIQRDFDAKITYVIDLSRFGTYINEKLIGPGRRMVLESGDLLSMGEAKFFVFLYSESTVTASGFPIELSNRYLLSNHVIGKGAMGRVFIGKQRHDKSVTVAIKAITKARNSFASKNRNDARMVDKQIEQEVEIMLKLKHPNCVRMEYACNSIDTFFIVMEYVDGGELFDRISDGKNAGCGIGEQLTKFYAWQLFSAIEFLHRNGIVHRDVKLENILLLTKDKYTVAKLTDFGMSTMNNQSLKTQCGTRCYMAPEMWSSELNYDLKVDIWALGVVIFACMCGYPPFSDDYGDQPLLDQIKSGRLYMYNEWKKVTKMGSDFVCNCLKVDAGKRFTAEQALANCWFNDPIVELSKETVQNYAVGDCC